MSEPQLHVADPRFDAKIRCRGGGVRVAVRGELDLATREGLAQVLDAAGGMRGDVVLDAVGVVFCDISAIGVLVAAYHRLHAQGRHFAVSNANAAVCRVLGLAGVGYLLAPASRRGRASAPRRVLIGHHAPRVEPT
jgi:anti-anti-sigma factor